MKAMGCQAYFVVDWVLYRKNLFLVETESGKSEDLALLVIKQMVMYQILHDIDDETRAEAQVSAATQALQMVDEENMAMNEVPAHIYREVLNIFRFKKYEYFALSGKFRGSRVQIPQEMVKPAPSRPFED